MASETHKVGYYGKLPLRGDFIQRNLDNDFTQFWDNWLQSVIATSRETLGENWLDFYLVSPVWRFYLPYNNGPAYCGVMLPSVDKVGRYFPFTIATMVESNESPLKIISNNQHWFNMLEDIALQALDESIDFDQLNTAIDNLYPIDFSSPLNTATTMENLRIPLSQDMSLDAAFSQLNPLLPCATSIEYNFWWSNGNEHIEGNLICINNLPDDNIYTAMLDGHWELCHIQTLDNGNTSTLNEFV